jgi:hypothetical protein
LVAYEDNLAAVFNLGGVTLRISAVTCFTPHEHTIPGFMAPDVVFGVDEQQSKKS